jgi:hypothetical protein
MKNIYLIIFLGFCLSISAQESKKKILIYNQITSNNCKKDAAEILNNQIPDEIASLIRNNLPCYDVYEKSVFQSILSFDRQRMLLGYPDESTIENIAGAFGCNYVIMINTSCNNGIFTVSASLTDQRNFDVKARNVKTGNDNSYEFVESFAKAFLEDLLYSEPCPYKGVIKIDDLEITSVDSAYDRKIACGNLGNTDGSESFNSKEERTVNRKIELNKIKKLGADGSFTSTMKSTKHSKYANNDCYVCSMDGSDASVKTTGDYSSEINENSKWNISGIASYKNGGDNLIKTSEAAIHFAKNGTYTVEIKAVSDYGVFEGSRNVKTNSTCAGQQSKNDPPLSTKINDKFKFTFGPFKGTPFDKVLKESSTMDVSDNNGNGKHKITYEFNLTKE